MIGRFDASGVIKKAIRVALLLATGAVIATVAFCEWIRLQFHSFSAVRNLPTRGGADSDDSQEFAVCVLLPRSALARSQEQPEYATEPGHVSRRLRSALKAGCRLAGRCCDNFAWRNHRGRNTGPQFIAALPRFSGQRTSPIPLWDLPST
jgi:hypothetical protein